MSRSVNKVMLLGRLMRDVELKYLSSGTAVAELGVAVSESYKDKSGQWQERASFIDCIAWSRTAEVASEYLGKGDPIHIEGRLQLDQWEKDGQKRSKLKVVVEKLTMVGGKRDGDSPRGSKNQYSEPVKPEREPGIDENEEVPF